MGDGPMVWDIPAAPGVERLWLLDQLGFQSAYNLPMVWRVDPSVTPDRIRAAIDALSVRHAALRAALVRTEAGLRCRISPDVRLPVTELPVATEAGLPHAALMEFAHRPFDLRRAPLARAMIAHGGSAGTVLGLVLHHAIGDGASLDVIQSHLAALLADRSLPPAEESADIALLRETAERQLGMASGSAGIQWWRSLLTGLPHCALPLDRPRPARPSGRGRRITEELPAGSVAALRGFSRSHHAPPFAVGLAAAQLLVGRFAGNRRPVLGTVLANRPSRELSSLVGFLANTVALPADLTVPGLTFTDLVRSTRNVLFDAIEHQDVPFDQVVAELGGDREFNRNPLFEVTFAAQESDPVRADGPLTPVAIDYAPAKFDVSLGLLLPPDTAGAATGEISALYAEDVLDEGSVREVARSLRVLLGAAMADPDVPVMDLTMTDRPDSVRLVRPDAAVESSASEADEAPAPEQIAQWAARSPGSVAVVDGGDVSYGVLDGRANAVAHALRRRDVARGDVVAVALPIGLAQVIAMLAVWKAGAVYLPVDPELPATRVEAMLADSAAVLLIDAGGRGAAPWPDGEAGPPRMEIGTPWGSADRSPPVRVDPADLAYVLFTSGSTGRPKGVAVSHGSLAGLIAAARRAVPQKGAVGALTSPSFDISFLESVAPLTAGGTVVPADRRGDWPSAFSGVGWLQLTPSHARLLLRDDAARERLRGLDTLVLAGERLTPELAGELTDLVRGSVVNAYGPTEATIWATVQELTAGHTEVVPIGRPLAGTTTAGVCDERGVPVPRGAVGELYLGGGGIAAGYLGRPALTADRFRPDPYGPPGARCYRTGDLARVRADGTLEFLGRSDAQLKVRGHRIEAGDVESALRTLDGVAEAAVDVRRSPADEDILVAYVVWTGGGAGDPEAEIREALPRQLPLSMVPSVVVPVPALPLSGNGKVDRSALARIALPVRDAVARTTGNSTEQALAELWTVATGVAAPDLEANFFDIGGTSLLLARFHALAGERFPRADLRIIDLFLARTLAGTAVTIAERTGLHGQEPTVDFAV